jgi:hypothetical protein
VIRAWRYDVGEEYAPEMRGLLNVRFLKRKPPIAAPMKAHAVIACVSLNESAHIPRVNVEFPAWTVNFLDR